jgi:Helicase associated domain
VNDIEELPTADCGSDSNDRFRAYQSQQWTDRFCDLQAFRMLKGHCLVPHKSPENPALSQWVKRQRYQYKLKQEGKHSTLTDEREVQLEALGFIWDSHKAGWEEKYKDLCLFREKHGHSNVPANYHDKSMAIWIKCQRRQHKLFAQGKRSAMNPERVQKLDLLDFAWNPRNL